MSRYIDAEELKKQIIGYGIVREGDFVRIPLYREHCAKMWTEMLRWFCEEVGLTPTADVAEVKHGRWLYDDGAMHKCSVCGELSCCTSHFCGECGAKMDEEE